jgi:membrane protein
MKVKNVFTYFTDTILRRNANSYRNPRVRWAVRQYKLLFYTARGLIAHDTIVRSAALTFYTLISIVPILAAGIPAKVIKKYDFEKDEWVK